MSQLHLEILAQHREKILKAELAAWLHNAGKLYSGHQSKYLKDQLRSNYSHARFGPGRSREFLNSSCQTGFLYVLPWWRALGC